MQAATVVVVEAVVGLGGMRAGARADEVKPPTSMQASGWWAGGEMGCDGMGWDGGRPMHDARQLRAGAIGRPVGCGEGESSKARKLLACRAELRAGPRCTALPPSLPYLSGTDLSRSPS